MWDTRQFNNKADWPTDGSQPFYWSNGERTGLGNHADYVFGWQGDALQRAMDGKCANDRCPPLKRQTDAQAVACTKKRAYPEEIGDVCKWQPPLAGITCVRAELTGYPRAGLKDIPGQTAVNYL